MTDASEPEKGSNEGIDAGSNNAVTADDRDQTHISLNAALGLLSHPQRRDILYYFRTNDTNTVSEESLVRYLTEQQAARSEGEPTSECIQILLSHTHIPKMADAGLISYDEQGGALTYCADERIGRLLDCIEAEYEDHS